MGPIQRTIVKASLRSVRHPWVTLMLALAVLALSLWLAFSRLAISSDQNQLFSESETYFRDYVRFTAAFPENEAIYVVVQQRDPATAVPLERWTAAAEAIAARIRPLKDYVNNVEYRVPTDKLGPWGLLFEEPAAVRARVADMARFSTFLSRVGEAPGLDALVLGDTPVERMYAMLEQGMARGTPEEKAESAPLLRELSRSLAETLDRGRVARERGAPVEPEVSLPDWDRIDARTPRDLAYFFEPDETDRTRNLLLIRVYEKRDFSSLTAISETVDAIRDAAKDAGSGFPEFHVGLTGRPVLEADELRTSEHDTRRSEIIAGIAVFLGLIVFLIPWSELRHAASWHDSGVIFLRGVWMALVALLSLAIAIGWTFGWATLAVGRLNLLSLVFVIALIGIGMDYLIQVLTRYRREAARYERAAAVWARVYRYVSPPISTACLGAAGAFLVSVLTPFRGAAELGIIAGGGLVLCLISGYTVLPALLTILPPGLKMKDTADRYGAAGAPPRAGGWRLLFPLAWVLALIALIPAMTRVSFDPNLLNLQARGLESVQLVRHLQTWYAVALSPDLEALAKVRDALAGAPTVESTDSFLKALSNADYLRTNPGKLPAIAWSEPRALKSSDLPGLTARLRRLADACRALGPEGQAAASALGRLEQAVADTPTAVPSLNAWQRGLLPQLQGLYRQFDPPPVDFASLPAEMRDHYVSYPRNGKPIYALYIYPREDLWEQRNLEAFVRDVESRALPLQTGSVDSDTRNFVLTGIAPELYHTTEAIRSSFFRATLYALALIVLLVFIDLRSITQTLIAISVLALGLPMLMAIMGLLGGTPGERAFDLARVLHLPGAHGGGLGWELAKFNLANFFGLPILIGAGHEYGVFMVHRYREVLHNPRRVWRPWDVSDRALLLCAYVTTSAFAFLLLGRHRGMQSLGFVMAVGTACIYLATIFVVRPLLLWRLQRKGCLAPPDAGSRP